MKTLNVMVRSKWAILKGGYQLNAIDMGLSGQWADKWDSYNEVLKIAGINLRMKKTFLLVRIYARTQQNTQITIETNMQWK